MKEYIIPNKNLPKLLKSLERLNRQLVKAGRPEIVVQRLREEEVADAERPGVFIPFTVLAVDGTEPVVNGWHFVATLVHTTEGNIIRAVPGYQVDPKFRDAAPNCEHCHVNRRRRDTFVLRHDDGRIAQVGSTCIRDFLGSEPGHVCRATELFISAFDLLDSATDRNWLGGGGVEPFRISTVEYLTFVAYAIRQNGGRYVTKRIEHDTAQTERPQIATASVAYNQMFSAFRDQPRDDAAPSEEDGELALAAIDWVRAQYEAPVGNTDADLLSAIVEGSPGRRDLSDFEHNLLAVAKSQSIEPRLCGITAYVVEAYRRSLPVPGVAQLAGEGLKRLFAMFNAAKEAKLTRPKVRLTDGTEHLAVTQAGDTSANKGWLYVKSDTVYRGKISPDGKFIGIRGCPPEVETLLRAFAADPEGQAGKYGQLTGKCCFCGLTLTDGRSTEVGYGPVCAKKFQLKWGKTVKAEELTTQETVVA